MKLQLKRSNQTTGSSGALVPVAPTAAQTLDGELCVNYNSGDPALFIKDADNNPPVRVDGNYQAYDLEVATITGGSKVDLVHKSSGQNDKTIKHTVNFKSGTNITVSSSGDDITIDTAAEVNVQADYTETDTSLDSYIQNKPSWGRALTNDSNTINADIATTTTLGVVSVGSGLRVTDEGELSVNLGETDDNILVEDGSTTNRPSPDDHEEGTLWWDSASDAGKLYVLYNDPAGGGGDTGGKMWVEASPMPNSTALDTVPDLGDSADQNGTLDTRYVRADVTDHKQGNLTIGDGPGNNNIRLNENGSAEFTGTVVSGGNPTNGANNGCALKSASGLQATGNVADSYLFRGWQNGSSAITSSIKANGSAEFAGGLLQVRPSGTLRKYHEASQVNTHFLDLGTNPTYTYLNSTSNGSGTSQPLHLLTKSAGQTKSFVFGTDGSLTVPGSAEFAGGDVEIGASGGSYLAVDRDTYRTWLNTSLNIPSVGDVAFASANDYDGTAASLTSFIKQDGSATFAGGAFRIGAGGWSVVNTGKYHSWYNQDAGGEEYLLAGGTSGAIASANVKLKLDGSAEFVSGLVNINNAGVIVGDASNGASNAFGRIFRITSGKTRVRGDFVATSGTTTDAGLLVGVQKDDNSGINYTTQIKYDGSAEFADGGITFAANGNAQFAGKGLFNEGVSIPGSYFSTIGSSQKENTTEGLVYISIPAGTTGTITLTHNCGLAPSYTQNGGSIIELTYIRYASNDVLIKVGRHQNFGNNYIRGLVLDGDKIWIITKTQNNGTNTTAQNRYSMNAVVASGVAPFFAAGTAPNVTNFVSSGAGSNETKFNNDLVTDGRAEFAGYVKASRQVSGNTNTAYLSASSVNGFELQQAGVIQANIGWDGSAIFVGDIDAGNVSFKLEPDNDANYTTTTDSEGNESRVYNGPTLDVKDRLTKADTALQTLKTAAAAAADFAELKAAIATALADI